MKLKQQDLAFVSWIGAGGFKECEWSETSKPGLSPRLSNQGTQVQTKKSLKS